MKHVNRNSLDKTKIKRLCGFCFRPYGISFVNLFASSRWLLGLAMIFSWYFHGETKKRIKVVGACWRQASSKDHRRLGWYLTIIFLGNFCCLPVCAKIIRFWFLVSAIGMWWMRDCYNCVLALNRTSQGGK